MDVADDLESAALTTLGDCDVAAPGVNRLRSALVVAGTWEPPGGVELAGVVDARSRPEFM